MVGQLPMGMLDDGFYVRFVSLFQEMASSLLAGADNIPNVVDVAVAPVPALAWLGSWLGVSWVDSSLPEAIQRRVVRRAGQALAWRGTERGLVTMLEAVTGCPVIVEDTGSVRPGTGDVPAPDPAVAVTVTSTGWMSDEDFVALVADEVPAPVRLTVRVDDRVIWPPSGTEPPSPSTGAVPPAPLPGPVPPAPSTGAVPPVSRTETEGTGPNGLEPAS